jgi:hypothetical protein
MEHWDGVRPTFRSSKSKLLILDDEYYPEILTLSEAPFDRWND